MAETYSFEPVFLNSVRINRSRHSMCYEYQLAKCCGLRLKFMRLCQKYVIINMMYGCFVLMAHQHCEMPVSVSMCQVFTVVVVINHRFSMIYQQCTIISISTSANCSSQPNSFVKCILCDRSFILIQTRYIRLMKFHNRNFTKNEEKNRAHLIRPAIFWCFV